MQCNTKKLLFLTVTLFWLSGSPADASLPIKRVPLTNTLFVGAVSKTPAHPPALYSISDFDSNYGASSSGESDTVYDLRLAASSFFQQGGSTLYIADITTPYSPESYRQALSTFVSPAVIGLIAAPGYGRLPSAARVAIASTLINWAEKSNHGFAVLESGFNADIDAVHLQREPYDTGFAAFYSPWVSVIDDRSSVVVNIAASGAVTGAIVQSELISGAHAAPAGISLQGLNGLTELYSDAQITSLAESSINPIRYISPSDFRLWGARTLSRTPATIYVNVQRYATQLEISIQRGTQWALAEDNSEPLWGTLSTQIESFLHNEWLAGALMGATPADAYFVRCDATTMSEADINAGRTICTWGAALIRPAEFSIFTLLLERHPAAADTTPPTGYSMRIVADGEKPLHDSGFSLQILQAELNSMFHYIIGSSGGEKILQGTGEVTAGNFQIDFSIDSLSALADGEITLYFSLTDEAGNLGPWLTYPDNAGNQGFRLLKFLPGIIKRPDA